MSSSLAIERDNILKLFPDTFKQARKSRLKGQIIFFLIILYLIVGFFTLDVVDIPKKWKPQNAAMFALDTYAHKDHVTMKWENHDDIKIAFEGNYRSVYGRDNLDKSIPDWFYKNSDNVGNVVEFNNKGKAILYKDRVEIVNFPKYERDFTIKLNTNGKPYLVGSEDLAEDDLKGFRITENRVEFRPTLYERIQVYPRKVEIHRYSIGWKYFWFDFSSPLEPYSFFEALGLTFSKERVVPEMSNLKLFFTEIKDNEAFMHGRVWWAMLETIVMAVLGTMFATVMALPLSFLAAYNVTPIKALRLVKVILMGLKFRYLLKFRVINTVFSTQTPLPLQRLHPDTMSYSYFYNQLDPHNIYLNFEQIKLVPFTYLSFFDYSNLYLNI